MKGIMSNNKKLLFLMVVILFFSIPTLGAKAYVLNGSKFQNPKQLRYYISDAVVNAGYWADAKHATTAWGYAAEIEFTGEIVQKVYAEIRFDRSTIDTGDFASASNDCYCTYSDYSNITLWKDFDSLKTDALQKETTVHEVGHSLGLAHENDNIGTSIMLDGDHGFIGAIYPQSDDWKGIAARY
ncbi:hypothetical protein ABES03_09860 [Neobacillus rhizosphaerae]|uniref:hypothetical protein n=1 Tax=Neobacillus rhizosphaerae TaxID=2880965 RepID=UPI003D2A0DE7